VTRLNRGQCLSTPTALPTRRTGRPTDKAILLVHCLPPSNFLLRCCLLPPCSYQQPLPPPIPRPPPAWLLEFWARTVSAAFRVGAWAAVP